MKWGFPDLESRQRGSYPQNYLFTHACIMEEVDKVCESSEYLRNSKGKQSCSCIQ